MPAYAAIGNRLTHGFSQDTGGTAVATAVATTLVYNPTHLNQYERVRVQGGAATGQRLVYDPDGNSGTSTLLADMNCDGTVNLFDIQIFVDTMQYGCSWYETHFPDCECSRADMTGDGSINVFDIQPFSDAMNGVGGEPSVPRFNYVWDAENRLVAIEPLAATPPTGAKRTRFAYDYMGRRVRTWEEQWSGSAWTIDNPAFDTRFIYDGWNLLVEIEADADHDGTEDDTPVRKYTWGLDLAGQSPQTNSRNSAGGIGGLLSLLTTPGSAVYFYFYDANGDICQLLDAASITTPAISARYEYDAYGNRINPIDEGELDQRFRFSTKYMGDTGFHYYGFRYYSPRLGRWTNRDPEAERNDINLYATVGNLVTTTVDPLGLGDYRVGAPQRPIINWDKGFITPATKH